MKSFLKNSFIFLLAVAVLYLIILTIISRKFGPVVDQYYNKLLSTHEGSLILGDSRAGQGVNPEILNSGTYMPFYNFAFTIGHTPWGEPYNNLIKKKFKGQAFNSSRIFILSISPWTLQGHNENPFPEGNLFTNNLILNLSNPNFEYLIRFYDNPVFDPIANYKSKNYVDENGRNTVKIDSHSIPDATKHAERVREYTSWLKTKGSLSEHRLLSLKKLISELNKYGKVFLVRIPVNKVFSEMENEYFPQFDDIITEYYPDTPFLNYFKIETGATYEFTDGCHLTKQSGNRFTEHLLTEINRNNKNQVMNFSNDNNQHKY